MIEIKDDKLRFSIRATEKDPLSWFEDKKVGDIVTTTVKEVMKTGVKVSVGNDKNLLFTIKKSHLAKEASDQRPEIFQPGNKLSNMFIRSISTYRTSRKLCTLRKGTTFLNNIHLGIELSLFDLLSLKKG